MKYKYLLFTFIFFAVSITLAICQPVVQVNAGESFFIGKSITYFVDTSRRLGINDVVNQHFQQNHDEILNLGITSDNVWIKFSVKSKTENELYLEVMAPLMQELEVYKEFNGKPERLFSGGFDKPFYTRPIVSENWLFKLNSTNQATTYYIKGHTGFNFQVPIIVSSQDKFIESNQWHNLFWGLYIGVMAFALIYNLFVFIAVRERRYFYYILYVIGSTVFYLSIQGFSFMLIWPDHPFLNKNIAVILCLTNVVVVLFAINFLNITKKQKGQYYFGFGIMVIFMLIALINILGSYEVTTVLAQVMSVVLSFYCIFLGVKSLLRGVHSAKFFLTAWTLFLVFVIIFILTINNIVVSNPFTTHCIFIGHMTEVLLLSFALADSINALKKENEDKQLEIIRQLKENEIIQAQANQKLEQKVAERTREVVEQKNEAENQRKISERLLLNILPAETAEELKSTGMAKAKMVQEVTVLFTDMKDFTQISEKLTPTQLVAEINECFSEFDRILEKYGVEKIKTIGDAYMAAGGLPTPNLTHAEDVVKAALEIKEFMDRLSIEKASEGKVFFKIRIGINTGPVVAGIVGIKKFAYDIWGDTVNIASCMESSSEAGKVNISRTTYDLIKHKYECSYRGKVHAKHKGMIDMYFVEKEIPELIQL